MEVGIFDSNVCYALCIFVNVFSNNFFIITYALNWKIFQRKLGQNKLLLLINKQT